MKHYSPALFFVALSMGISLAVFHPIDGLAQGTQQQRPDEAALAEEASTHPRDLSSGTCGESFTKHCPGIEDGFHARRCLTAHTDELEGKCKESMQRFKSVLDLCSGEAIAICRAPWKGWPKMFRCIAKHPSISVACKKIVEAPHGAPQPKSKSRAK